MMDVVQKLWGFCHTLRHDGIDYGDYIEQITYLLFLKMANERGIDLTAVPMKALNHKTIMLDCSWPRLVAKSGTELTNYYIEVLRVNLRLKLTRDLHRTLTRPSGRIMA